MCRRFAITPLIALLALACSLIVLLWLLLQPTPLIAEGSVTASLQVCETTDTVLPIGEKIWISAQPRVNDKGDTIVFWSTANFTNTFNTNNDANVEIFGWRPAISITPTQITSSTGNAFGGFNISPSITQDGDYISFISERNLTITGTNGNSDDNFEIYVAGLTTSGDISVTEIASVTNSRGVSNRSPQIAKNDQSLWQVTQSQLHSSLDDNNILQADQTRIYLPLIVKPGATTPPVNNDGKFLRVFFLSNAENASSLSTNTNSSLSNPDKNSEVFYAERAITSSSAFTASAFMIAQLTQTDGNVNISDLSLNGTGARFAYVERSTTNENRPELHVVDVNQNGLPAVLTVSVQSPEITIEEPRLSQDGQHLIFRSNAKDATSDWAKQLVNLREVNTTEQVFVLRISNNQVITLPITSNAENQLIAASISGDGKRISVMLHNIQSGADKVEIYEEDANNQDKYKELGGVTSLISSADDFVMSSLGNGLAYVQSTHQATSTIVSKRCPIANITATIASGRAHADKNSKVDYTIFITNTGPDDATNVTLTLSDLNLANIIKKDGVQVPNSPLPTSLTWFINLLKVNKSQIVSFTVQVHPNHPGEYIAGKLTIDSNTVNRGQPTAPLIPVQITGVDLTSSITVTNQAPKPAELITYTIKIRNNPTKELSYPASGVHLSIGGLPDGSVVTTTHSEVFNNGVWEVAGPIGSGDSRQLQIVVSSPITLGGKSATNVILKDLNANQDEVDTKNDLPKSFDDVAFQVIGTNLVVGQYSVQPPKPKKNSTVIFTYTLTNNGPADQHKDIFKKNQPAFNNFAVDASAKVPDLMNCRNPLNQASPFDNPATGSCQGDYVLWTGLKIAIGETRSLTWQADITGAPVAPIIAFAPLITSTFDVGSDAKFPYVAGNLNNVSITVNRVPTLQATLSPPSPVQEGVTVALQLIASDDDPQEMPLAINWGDGRQDTGITIKNNKNIEHVYADDSKTGEFQITATVTDSTNQSASNAPLSIVVENVAPTINDNLNLSPTIASDVSVGITTSTVITFNPFFTDPGFSVTGFTTETFTYRVNWGDIEIGPLDVTNVKNGEPGQFTEGGFTITHTYSVANTYPVTITVYDDEGFSDSKTVQIHVHN